MNGDDIEIPWTKEELEEARALLELEGMQPVANAMRILLKPLVRELLKRKTEG